MGLFSSPAAFHLPRRLTQAHLATWKALLLVFFVLAASPTVSHAISSAAYRVGIPIVGKRDALKGKMERGKEKDS